MLGINRSLLVALISIGITAAMTAQAGNQLFTGSWLVKSWGNEITGGTGPSEFYDGWGLPQGNLCNADFPRCPFASTPTDGAGGFQPLGNVLGTTTPTVVPFCAPWANWRSQGTTARPAKGGTYLTTSMNQRTPPIYRNKGFFTPSGQPNTHSCTATSTDGSGGKGLVQAGAPVTGTWAANTSTAGGFSFIAAPPKGNGGIRTTGQVGSFPNAYPYLYSYTYATLRNNAGAFAPGDGPGNFNLKSYQGANTTASVRVKQGAAKFGGTMRMLGALTTKACLFRNGGCSIGTLPLLYAAAGESAYTVGGVVTGGYVTTTTAKYYHTALMQTSTVLLEGERFPWTTGSVTVTAIATATHTVEYAHGYDNRDPFTHKGTIQLVTPVLTRWLQPGFNIASGGIGILRIKFVPEPRTWSMLVAGVSLIVVGCRLRRR